MKKSVMKFVSMFLVVIMLACVAVPAFAAQDAADDLPIIYVPGRYDTLYNNKTGEKIYPVVEDEVQYTKDSASVIAKAFAKAVAMEPVKGQAAWNEYCDLVYEKVSYMFSTIQLDENGNPKDDTGMNWDASTVSIDSKKSGYGLYDYTFKYDWRIDPCESARELKIYVDRIKQATGHDKVKMYIHCLGGTIFSAYLALYGSDDIEGVVMSVPTVTGSDTVGAIYSNQIVFDPDAISNYATYYLNSSQNRFVDEDSVMISFLTAIVTTLNEAKVLGYGTDMVKQIYNKIKDNIVPRLIKSCFFFPTYYAMIGDEYYNDAVDLIFNGDFKTEYAGYLEKINYYHDNVQTKAQQLLADAQANGMKVSIIARYGFNLLPISKNCDTLGDGRMEVSSTSYGATTSNMNDQLSKAYIAQAEENGTAKYISADRKIDASTCLFPDSTWFIRNSYHADSGVTSDLTMTLLNSKEQPTVNDFEQYPQFMHYNSDGDEKYTPVESDDYELDSLWIKDIYRALIRLLTSFIKVITSLITGA